MKYSLYDGGNKKLWGFEAQTMGGVKMAVGIYLTKKGWKEPISELSVVDENNKVVLREDDLAGVSKDVLKQKRGSNGILRTK